MSYELVWGEATFDEIVATRDRGIIDCVDRHLRSEKPISFSGQKGLC